MKIPEPYIPTARALRNWPDFRLGDQEFWLVYNVGRDARDLYTPGQPRRHFPNEMSSLDIWKQLSKEMPGLKVLWGTSD